MKEQIASVLIKMVFLQREFGERFQRAEVQTGVYKKGLPIASIMLI